MTLNECFFLVLLRLFALCNVFLLLANPLE